MPLSRILKTLLGTILGLPVYMTVVYIIYKVTGKVFLESFLSAGFMGFVTIFAIGLFLSEENLAKLRSQKD